MRLVLLWAALLLVCAPSAARASDEVAESVLGEAMLAYGQARYDQAMELLDRAEKETGDPKLLSRIIRQRGLIAFSTDKPDLALTYFFGALIQDSRIELRGASQSRNAVEIFQCARKLYESGATREQVGDVTRARNIQSGWTCPEMQIKKTEVTAPIPVPAAIGPVATPAPTPSPSPSPGKKRDALLMPPKDVGPPPKTYTGLKTWGLVVTIAGLVGGGVVGTYFFIEGDNDLERFETLDAQLRLVAPSSVAEADKRRLAELSGEVGDDRAIARIGYVSGGVMAAVGITLMIIGSALSDDVPHALVPTAAPGALVFHF